MEGEIILLVRENKGEKTVKKINKKVNANNTTTDQARPQKIYPQE